MISLIQVLPKVDSLVILNLSENVFNLNVAQTLGDTLPYIKHIKKLVLRNCYIGSNYSS